MLIEEGLGITPLVIFSMLAGIFLLGAINRIVPHKHETKEERISFQVFIAMCLHEFPEGVAFGSSYLVYPYLGLATAVLIALHNIPEGSIVSFPFFMKKKFSKGFKANLITQILFIAGGLSSYCLLLNVSQESQALGMTFAAGIMLYIVVEEILYIKGHRKKLSYI